MGAKPSVAVLACTLAVGGALSTAPADPGFENSVVRIVTHAQPADWYTPWDASPVSSGVGSGFVVAGGRILTNAHVVSDTRMILVYLYGDPNPHEARVAAVGHDCDLALVEPLEPDLLDRVPALALGGLPAPRSVVETYGYPAGSDQISSTTGVVSRVDVHVYAHSGVDGHLTVQTDAAINPGNSGGPVVQQGRVVGVAFQGQLGLENVGLFIPVEVIRHFLDDLKDGRYDGYPDLAIRSSTLENRAARRFAGMADGESGVRVDFVSRDGTADGHLEVGDVVLEVDGHAVANDGSVEVSGLRLPFGTLVDRHQLGDPIRLTVLRDRQRRRLEIPAASYPRRHLYGDLYDTPPRYFVYGGLVFAPLDQGMLRTVGDEWLNTADRHLIHEYLFRPLEDPEQEAKERVVLLRRLNHGVNVQMAWNRNLVVERVNGRAIDSLKALIAAIEGNREPYHVFEFAGSGRFNVMDRAQAERANREILDRYGVVRDRNP